MFTRHNYKLPSYFAPVVEPFLDGGRLTPDAPDRVERRKFCDLAIGATGRLKLDAALDAPEGRLKPVLLACPAGRRKPVLEDPAVGRLKPVLDFDVLFGRLKPGMAIGEAGLRPILSGGDDGGRLKPGMAIGEEGLRPILAGGDEGGRLNPGLDNGVFSLLAVLFVVFRAGLLNPVIEARRDVGFRLKVPAGLP